MNTPDGYIDSAGIREIDVTIYDDYPVYLMENRDMSDVIESSMSGEASFNQVSNGGSPGSSSGNDFYRSDAFTSTGQTVGGGQ